MDLLPLRVLYNLDPIANIFSLIYVTSHLRVTMDTNNQSAMFVHTISYYVLKFYQCLKGLYHFDTSAPNVSNTSVKSYSLLTTVQENNKCFKELKFKERIM